MTTKKKSFKPAAKLGGAQLSALWIAASFESGLLTGNVMDSATYKAGKVKPSEALTRYFMSDTVVTYHGLKKARMIVTGRGPDRTIEYNKDGLEFLQGRVDGSGDIKTPAAMVRAMRTILKTGKSVTGNGLDSIAAIEIK